MESLVLVLSYSGTWKTQKASKPIALKYFEDLGLDSDEFQVYHTTIKLKEQNKSL